MENYANSFYIHAEVGMIHVIPGLPLWRLGQDYVNSLHGPKVMSKLRDPSGGRAGGVWHRLRYIRSTTMHTDWLPCNPLFAVQLQVAAIHCISHKSKGIRGLESLEDQRKQSRLKVKYISGDYPRAAAAVLLACIATVSLRGRREECMLH